MQEDTVSTCHLRFTILGQTQFHWVGVWFPFSGLRVFCFWYLVFCFVSFFSFLFWNTSLIFHQEDFLFAFVSLSFSFLVPNHILAAYAAGIWDTSDLELLRYSR